LTPHNALLCSRSQPDRSAGTGVQIGGYLKSSADNAW
jgi:hypothetical protein